MNLRGNDIDIAHRLGKKTKNGKPRQILVNLNSRMKRDANSKTRKMFQGSYIYVNEDLTKTNQWVLAYVREKMKDVEKKVWSKNGRIFYKKYN